MQNRVIADWRKRRNFTQAEAAADLCVTLRSVQYWEGGIRPPPGLVLKYIERDIALLDLIERLKNE